MLAYRFPLLALVFVLAAAACAPAAPSNPADSFAGNWEGTMHFDVDPAVTEDIEVSIPTGCSAGQVCGQLHNLANECTWELTLGAVNGDVFEYTFSKTLSGECPFGSGGTFTMNADGTLFREHTTPDFVASGALTKK